METTMPNKLWIAGCSIAHGDGVNRNQRWGELLGAQLNLPTQFLTAPGSSIEWATNQILQADIQRNDILCWGLTAPNRSLWYHDDGRVQHILNATYQICPDLQNTVDRRHLIDLNLAYKAVNYVKQVQNYLNKIGCKYAIGYTLPGLADHREVLLKHLSSTPNFAIMYDRDRIKPVDAQTFLTLSKPAYNLFIDVGTDGVHPGPQQHQLYAEHFLKTLKSQDK